MKTRFLVAALAAIALTSCQKEEPEGPIESGQDTYIGMTIQLPQSASGRAFNGDANATQAESKITTLSVGVWSDGDGAITYTDFTSANLTNNNDGTYTAITAAKAKTGKNNIIVIVNSSTRPTIMQALGGEPFAATVADIATDDNFVMYSTIITVLPAVVAASKSDVEAGTVNTNKATVTLRRAAAKVAITSSLAATDGTGIVDGLSNGRISNIVWGITNLNTQMTVIAKPLDGNAANFVVRNIESPFAHMAAYAAPTTPLPATGGAASIAYCLGNSHGIKTYNQNNTTAVQVSATFTPGTGKYVSAITGSTALNAVIVMGTADMVPGVTFYVSKRDIGTAIAGTYFNDASVTAAITLFGATAADFTKYDSGKCYWPIWINDGATTPNYGVLRNNMYTMNITSIKAPGYPSFPNTSDPIAADTWIKVDLTVEQWIVKNMGNINL